MADYVIRSSREIKGCDGCPCQNYSLIMHVPFCKLALETLTEEYAKQKPKWCPLVELPPHGDLIERDELLTDLADRICVDDMLDGIYQPAIDRINEAKTVLEASKERE